MTATALIAEDEPLLQEQLAEALVQLWPELEIVGRTRDGIEALRHIEQCQPTIVFLDIQMPGLTGLEVAKQVAGRAHVVFVTAYDQHAISAFEQGAIDYILKPVTLGRLVGTVQRLKERIARPAVDLTPMLAGPAARAGEACGHLRRVNVSGGASIKLATALFTDTVDSTATAARVGDRAWRELLEEHDRRCRRAIGRFGGRWIKSTADGVFATFEGPAGAIDSAIAIAREVGGLGLCTRAGVHTGECEVEDDAVRAIAVHVGARIAALAGPGEVLVCGIVRDLVTGSGIAFVDRGEQALKGVPGAVRVLAVAGR